MCSVWVYQWVGFGRQARDVKHVTRLADVVHMDIISVSYSSCYTLLEWKLYSSCYTVEF